MTRTRIKGKWLEFDEELHQYFYDGIMLPSVTSVLDNSQYEGVSPRLLKRASDYGRHIHKLIEEYEEKGTVPEERPIEFRNYLFLKRMYKFKTIKSELPLVIWCDDEPVLAGTCDAVTEWQGHLCVEDYKVRATLNKDEIAKQLNLYRLGLKQSYDIETDRLFCVQVKNTTRRRLELPINEEYTKELIKRRAMV